MIGSELVDTLPNYAERVLKLLILGAMVPVPRKWGQELEFDWVNGVAMCWGFLSGLVAIVPLLILVLGFAEIDSAITVSMAAPSVYETMLGLVVVGAAAVGGAVCERVDREIRDSEFWEWGRNPL